MRRRCFPRGPGAGLLFAALSFAVAEARAQTASTEAPAGPARLMVQSGRLGGGTAGWTAEQLALAPGGQLLATANPDSLRVWHAESGRLLCELQLGALHERHQQLVEAARASRSGQAQPSRSSRQPEPQREPESGLFNPLAMAWSADGATLYGTLPGLPLQRWDVARCRPAGELALPFPGLQFVPPGITTGLESDFFPRQLQGLADGSLLANSPGGLYRLRVRGDRLEAEMLADRARLRAAAPPAAGSADGAGASARAGDLRGMLGNITAMAARAAADALGLGLLGASADGRTVLLGQPPFAGGIGGVAMMQGGLNLTLPVAQPLLVQDGQAQKLDKLQGARASYAGVTLALVSPSGRWLALRSDAPGGARLSLFDLQARRLAGEVELGSGAPNEPEAASGAAPSGAGRFFSGVWAGNAANQALAGLAFAPDERQLVLFRHRAEPGAGRAEGGPLLELRSLEALGTVQRRVPLQGSVLPPADLGTMFMAPQGNLLVPAAGGQSFAFQMTRASGSATLVTARWRDGLPLLRPWTPGEGTVDQLVFADEEHLLSTHRASLLPGDEVQALMPGAGAKPAPEAGIKERFIEMANASQGSLQVVRWSFDTGQVERLYADRVLLSGNLPVAASVDPLRQRRLALQFHAEPGADRPRAELVLRTFDERSRGWQRPPVDSRGKPFTVEHEAFSPDGRWLAIVVRPDRQGSGDESAAVASAPVPAADTAATAPTPAPSGGTSMPSGIGRVLADRVRPHLAEKLRDAVRSLRGRSPSPAPAASAPAPVAAQAPAPAPAPVAPSAAPDVWLAGDGTQPSLVLVDAASGRALATMAIGADEDRSKVLQFISGDRLLVGQRLVEIQARDGGWRLSAAYGLAYDGRFVGLSAKSGRPIVAGGRSAGSLRTLELPAAYQRAQRAATSADDRWLAVAQDDRLTVLDTTRGMAGVISLGLDGARVDSLSFSPAGRVLAVGLTSGLIRLVDAPRARELATLMASSDGHWTVVDPKGRLDSSNLGGNAALHWVTPDNPLKPLPFDTLMRAYQVPDLLARAVHGDAALDALPSMAGRLRATPRVAIDAVEPMAGAPDRVRLRVSVTAAREPDGSLAQAFDLRVLRDGRLVAFAPAADGALALDAAGRAALTFDDVRLPEGDEPVYFQAYAFNRDGVRGDTASAEWRPPRPVKLGPGRAYVLTVGVNRYDVPDFATLAFAVNDARLVAQALGDGLRRSGAWRDVVTLTLEAQPGGRNDATKARIEAALGVLAGRPEMASRLAGVPGAQKLAAATPADLVVLAFAGHGYISPATRELQLVPSDVAAAAGAEGLARFDRSSISALELDRWLRPLDAGHLAIVIDACHSAAAVAEGFRGGPSGSRGLGQLAADKGARLLAATQAADQALEHQRLQHGLLTYVLVKEGLVAGLADTRPADGRIDMLEWLRYAEQRLPRLQLELARGDALPAVQGERASGRGASRPSQPAVDAASRVAVQRPRLFDFVPPGHAEPVMGQAPP